MGEQSKIEWTHHTFNPWWGCERVSPGCAHCYAETFAKRTGHNVWGKSAERRLFGDKHWNEPVKWDRDAALAGERRRVFCASMADVFEDRDDLVGERAQLWQLIAETPNLDWLLLTKRPENAKRMLPWADRGAPWKNVWLGTTAEDQQRADERIPILLDTPAAVRFLSCEPLLRPLDLAGMEFGKVVSGIDWVIVGGESGPGARWCHVGGIRSIVHQCAGSGVPVFVKQLGAFVVDRNDRGCDGDRPDEWPTGTEFEDDGSPVYQGKLIRVRLNDRKGGAMDEWPLDLRVREFPNDSTETRRENEKEIPT